jgi:hypothetical protein
MTKRFVFRQVCSHDLGVFLEDGEIRSKNHENGQLCHQTSYVQIVERRGRPIFQLPHGGVVNDYVPFYFSPISSFTYTINRGNVDLRSPAGEVIGKASDEERMFFVCDPVQISNSGLPYCFSNLALNTQVPLPSITANIAELDGLVDWNVFDEIPMTASIPEIGYEGVCAYFRNQDSPQYRQNRSQKRMAEFLVKGAVPLSLVTCVVVKTEQMHQKLQRLMDASNWDIPIHTKPSCYF